MHFVHLSYQKKLILQWKVAHIMGYSGGIPQYFIEEIRYANRP